MSDLPNLLSKPIKWHDWSMDDDVHAFLCDLQANVLKGHGRDHTANVFLSFGGMTVADVADLLRDLSCLVTSAFDQLRSSQAFKLVGVSGGRVLCLFLAHSAYRRLGLSGGRVPSDKAFAAGMQERGQLPSTRFEGIDFSFPAINDPPKAEWEEESAWDPSKPKPDAMLLIADDDAQRVAAGVELLQALVSKRGATVLGADLGLAQRRKQAGGDERGEGIEHFGYVDGVSQPIFLAEDVPAPAGAWPEDFLPSQFIVRDPGAVRPFSCGSYFVYRKLEQNVQLFKDQEEALAKELRLTGDDRERAGALVVGRFEDGTPFAKHTAPVAGVPTNDFAYGANDDQAPAQAQCPFRAHIRKTNPRTESTGDRSRIMARRGITYGTRARRTPDEDFAKTDRPTGGVGLLFMAYMSNIAEQFEFTQSAWVNNVDFRHPGTGVDPVIGQSQNPQGLMPWRDPVTRNEATFDFKTAVKLMGGEYFFAPSISFLQRCPDMVVNSV